MVPPSLLAELRRALTCPKLRRRIDTNEAEAVEAWLRASALIVDDPTAHPLTVHSRDRGDDYLLALAAAAGAVLVTGDEDLLELSEDLPVHTAAGFIAALRT